MNNSSKFPKAGRQALSRIGKSLAGLATKWSDGEESYSSTAQLRQVKTSLQSNIPRPDEDIFTKSLPFEGQVSLVKEDTKMTLKEERMQILKMLEEGKITAEEAANLLSALDVGVEKEQEADRSGEPKQSARWLRIRVTDGASGKQKVNVNLPMGLVNAGMKIGAKFAPEVEEVNLNEIIEAIKSGAHGKIIDVHDEIDGEHVEIFVE